MPQKKTLTDKQAYFKHQRQELKSQERLHWKAADTRTDAQWRAWNTTQRANAGRSARRALAADGRGRHDPGEALQAPPVVAPPVVAAPVIAPPVVAPPHTAPTTNENDAGQSRNSGARASGNVPPAKDPQAATVNGKNSGYLQGTTEAASQRPESLKAGPPPAGPVRTFRRDDAAGRTPDWKEKHWISRGHIGAGTYGVAHLYVELDDHEKIRSRIVVKDSWATPQLWSNIGFWHGDPRKKESRVPAEIKAMQNMLDRPGSDKVVRYLTHTMFDERMSFRIIMSYCGHGSLHDIVDDYQTKKQEIPEPALWRIFEALAEACLLMECGTTDTDAEADEDWEQIVHRGTVFMKAKSDHH